MWWLLCSLRLRSNMPCLCTHFVSRSGSDLPILLIQTVMYVGIIAVTRLARPSLSKLCYNRRPEKSIAILHTTLKIAAFWSMLAAYSVPFFLIPRTAHPLFGWSLYMLGVASLSSIVINVFLLPPLPVLTVLLGMLGSLFVMAFPWYPDGVIRALIVFAYAFCYSPIAWASLMKVTGSLQNLVEREAFFPRMGVESTEMSEFNKLYWSAQKTGQLPCRWSELANLINFEIFPHSHALTSSITLKWFDSDKM